MAEANARSAPKAPRKRQKRRFSYEERYAVWRCHGPQCSLCGEPLRLIDTTIDHFLPESLLDDPELRERVLSEWGLPQDFDIQSFANWLPAHSTCNQRKGSRPVTWVPGNGVIMDKLRREAGRAEGLALAVKSNRQKDLVFAGLFAALEARAISLLDVWDWLAAFADDPASAGAPDDVVVLDNGYWVKRSEIAREGTCVCERAACVGRTDKVYCYFSRDLPRWVVDTGLYRACYDEVVTCPRCSQEHKRGHIGSGWVCGRPYAEQREARDRSSPT